MPEGPPPPTVADLVRARRGDHRIGLRQGQVTFTHHQLASGAAARAALFLDTLPRDAEPHIGVLLDNTPEYPLWLAAAALAGGAVVGLNPTRRGAESARDIAATDCALLVTDRAHLPLLPPDTGIRVLVTDDEQGAYQALLTAYEGAEPAAVPPRPDARLLLYFTSGSTGAPKAAVCTQGRLAAAGHALVRRFGVTAQDTHYICMPMFHGNAVIGNWAPALAAGAAVALRERFSASGFLDDVRAYRATYFTYIGRTVQYLLATGPRPEDRDHVLRTGFGTEAGAVDAARFEKRFGVRLTEGYGSSEGGAALQWTPGTPAGAVGRASPGDDLAVVDPATGAECPAARFDENGRVVNSSAAIGELVNRGRSPFQGYWRNETATAERTKGGWYWTGDLFFRDTDGYLYFAGRGDDRLRVDGENLAAAMIENILARHPAVASVAVYAVPDPVSGDQVMAALTLHETEAPDSPGSGPGSVPGPGPGPGFDVDGFAAFLAAQDDLGTKMAPRFVRVLHRMPVTATNKIHRAALRRTGFRCPEPVWWSPPAPGRPCGTHYRPLTGADTAELLLRYAAHGRSALLELPGARPRP